MKKAIFRMILGVVVLGVGAAIFFLVRGWHQRRAREIPVLMYHNIVPGEEVETVWQVSVEEFRRQMGDLARGGYTTILPEDIWRASCGRGWLPKKPVVITFDDGLEGVLRHAEPVLREHGFRAICYVIVHRISPDEGPRRVFGDPLMRTNEVRGMARRGTVAIGVHSLTHGKDTAVLIREAEVGRWALGEELGIQSWDYCYPYGSYRADGMREGVCAGGYRTACICEDRMFRYGAGMDLLAIPRLSVYGGRHEIRIIGRDAAAGEVVVRNGGEGDAATVPLPLKAVARDCVTGRVVGESGVQRVGASPCVLKFPGAYAADAAIELWDAAGLFRYDGGV